MKAIVVTEYGKPDVMQVKDVPVPKCADQEVLIRVKAIAVNYSDIILRYAFHHTIKKPPYIPGVDISGVVTEVGKGVKDIKLGQRVMAFTKSGAYAEYALADSHLIYPLSDEIDYKTGAAIPVMSFTAYHLLYHLARIRKRETVLIHAASGGVGTIAIQLAKYFGAAMVIGTVSSDDKKQAALLAGADHVINYQKEDVIRAINKLVPQKIDIVLDSLAGEIGERSVDCLASNGRLISYGNSSGRDAMYNTNDLQGQCRSIMGFSLSKTRVLNPEMLKDTSNKVTKLFIDGNLKVINLSVYPLEDAKKAHELIELRKSTGKIILEP